MIRQGQLTATRQIRRAFAPQSAASASATAQYGRSAVYRRFLSSTTFQHYKTSSSSSSLPSLNLPLSFARPRTPLSDRIPTYTLSRLYRPLHSSTSRYQQPAPSEDIRDPPREGSSSKPKAEDTARASSEESAKSKESEEGSSESKEESGEKSDKKKEDAPPPPPHGDKSPWQVFTQTLRTEFKASKEWNEGTKQLASSAHQFTESEGVRRARAAYDATAGAAGSKTAEAIKTTGKAIGQGAAWTWDSKVVQGVRAGVNATGRGIEQATRPVRETEAFKNVKEAIDDGSSTRYGGWIEKEERRRKREARERREMQSGRRPMEKMEEDPKYALIFTGATL